MNRENNTLLQALNWRYAVKKFATQKVSKNELAILLEAMRLTPSAYGLQPYTIAVIEDTEIRERLLPYSFGQDKVVNNSHLIVIAAHTDLSDDMVNRYIEQAAKSSQRSAEQLQAYQQYLISVFAKQSAQQKQQWAHQQAYIALGNLLTSAALLSIDCCPMSGFEAGGFDEVLGFAEKGLTTTVICPIGYRHPDDMAAFAPKVRFATETLIIEG